MLTRVFDPSQQHRVYGYYRMSTRMQNPRSPEQQKNEIETLIARRGLSWTIVGEYSDRGKSGQLTYNRPQYQQMMQDIASSKDNVSLILVDTLERLGRVDEMPQIRERLKNNFGVLVLTADSGFADPTSTAGRALGFVESIRSTEEGRVKAHNVLRGKRDAILNDKRWPGGKPPLGLKLEAVLREVNDCMEVDFKQIVPDPQTAWIVGLLFDKARATGWGGTRLAKFLNDHPDIPQELKPFHVSTVLEMLKNPLYKGELLWAEHSTGIVNDVRVRERNDEEEMVRVPGFCEPIVPPEIWDEVNQLRQRRASAHHANRRKTDPAEEPLIVARGTGIALNYPLTGLLFCGTCGRRMNVFRSGTYRTKSGEERQYTQYRCPAYHTGGCENCVGIPEDWLRPTVLKKLIGHFLPGAGDSPPPPTSATSEPEWLEELRGMVVEEAKSIASHQPERVQQVQAELQSLDEHIQGWMMSLSNRNLPLQVRQQIEAQMETAIERQTTLQSVLAEEAHRDAQLKSILPSNQVMDRLNNLQDVLANAEPTRVNLELSLHIDRIDCHTDGRLVMRTCRLGASPNSLDLLRDANSTDLANQPGSNSPKALRRRGRLKILSVPSRDDSELRALRDFAADSDRFAGLDEKWFWFDEFHVPNYRSWTNRNAEAVQKRWYELEAENGKRPSNAALAREFSVSTPTIRKALAIETGDVAPPTARRRWGAKHGRTIDELLDDVAALFDRGVPLKQIAKELSVSKSSVVRAVDLIHQQRGIPRPDLRRKAIA